MTKSCVLKGSQKVFLLHLDQASSCCRAHPMPLSAADSVAGFERIWQEEGMALDQGHELAGCQHCWDHEQQGIQSYRQQFSTSTKNFNTIELHIDNTCNQMCGYCSPKFSSAWQASILDHGMFSGISASARHNLLPIDNSKDPKNWLLKIQDYINSCDDNSINLILLGGEPLMQKRNLEQLLAANLQKIHQIHITTNLNPPTAKFLHWILEVFPKEKLIFKISLDSVPEYNSVPRAGFDIKKFQENIELLKTHGVEFSFLTVISVLNIFSLTRYQQWLDQQNYNVKFFKINNPDCLDPIYLPHQFKEKLLAEPLPHIAQDCLVHQASMIDIKQFEQYNYLKQYFDRTNTKITEPEFANYWLWLEEKFK